MATQGEAHGLLIAVTHGGGAGWVVGKDHATVDGVIRHIIYFCIDLIIVVARPVNKNKVDLFESIDTIGFYKLGRIFE